MVLFFCYNSANFDKNTCYHIQLKEVINIKLTKSILKIINKDYNDINKDNFMIEENINPYGILKNLIN